MDSRVVAAMQSDLVVDITTIGRNSGVPRRIEIWLLHLDGRFFITGTPGRRDWLANLRTDPQVVLHLKQDVTTDVVMRAVEITDEPTRRQVLGSDAATWYRQHATLDELIAGAPLVELLSV